MIKSKLILVHRRTQQFTADTILKLKAKIVPTGQKINWAFWGPFGLIYPNLHRLFLPLSRL